MTYGNLGRSKFQLEGALRGSSDAVELAEGRGARRHMPAHACTHAKVAHTLMPTWQCQDYTGHAQFNGPFYFSLTLFLVELILRVLYGQEGQAHFTGFLPIILKQVLVLPHCKFWTCQARPVTKCSPEYAAMQRTSQGMILHCTRSILWKDVPCPLCNLSIGLLAAS